MAIRPGDQGEKPPLGTDPAEDAIAAMASFGRILMQVDDEHLDSRSRISNPDNVIGRLMSIENSIAKLNYQ